MDRTLTERLLRRAREAEWAFPTSFSASNLAPGAPWVEGLVADRNAVAEAALLLLSDGRAQEALEIAARTWRLWLLAGDPDGGRAFLGSVLDAAGGGSSRWRALALYGDGMIAARLGEWDVSRARNDEALVIANRAGDDEALVFALIGTSRRCAHDGSAIAALSTAEEALELARSMPLPMQQAPLHLFAQALRTLGDLEGAVALFRESLELNRAIGDPHMVAVELHNLGHVELRLGNLDAAERCFDGAAATASPDDPYDAAMTNLNRAAMALARGMHGEAAAGLAEARRIFADAGIEAALDDAAEMDRLDARLRMEAM